MTTGTGAVIDGRYQLGRQIGRGGMAVVHFAEDERLGREVAVKLLDRQVEFDGRGEDRFDREARRAASLNHPNIVQVHDTGVDLDHPYIVMEFVDGPSLADVLAEEGPLDPGRAVDVAVTICGALEAAHEKGIVHRDIKPSNVLFDRKGRVKLADFGLAKAHGGDTVTQGSPMGSAAYVAPEQITDSPVDHRADLFSLGVVIYEMVTGVRPYSGETAAATAVQRLAHAAPPPSEHAPISAELERVILRLLEREPEDRFGSAAEAAAALRRAREDSTQTLPIIVPDRDTQPRRGRWLLLFFVAALAVAAALFLWPETSESGIVVPDVSGMTVEAATRVLEAEGLEVGEIVEEPTDGPTGIVLDQIPDQGVRVDEGGTVDLVVAASLPESTASPTSSPTPTETDTGGTSDGGAATTDGGTTDDTSDADAEPGTGGGNGADGEGGPDGTPPGQGGEPPGQGGDPPGRGG